MLWAIFSEESIHTDRFHLLYLMEMRPMEWLMHAFSLNVPHLPMQFQHCVNVCVREQERDKTWETYYEAEI